MKNIFIVNSITKSLYIKAFSILVCILFLGNVYYSQKPSREEKKIFKKAKKQLANEQFKKAQANYLKLININPKDEIYNFEGGLSYYFADFERSKSVALFEAALENSIDDTIPELYYYLARAYHLNGEYKKSKEAFINFKPFIKTNSKAGQELMKQSDYYIKISENGNKYLAKKNEDTKVLNLGININSAYGEYAPVFKKNDNVLLFTSRRKSGNSKKVDTDQLPYEDVYIAKLVNNEWQLISDKDEMKKYIPKNLNTKKHDAGVIYSSDGNTLYTYKNDLIWKSILENGKWSNLVELDENINSSQYNVPSVNLSEDGNTIYFVSTRKKEGYGGKDIYKSIKNKDGKWNTAENLGDNINTKFDEDSPFISANGKTLYFASKGHSGMGGYDLFKSKLTNGSWSKPENMGIPINSSLDDIYLILDADEKNGFFSSARDGGIGGMDIYSYCYYCPANKIHILDGLIVDNNNTPIKKGTLSFRKINENDITGIILTNNGKFKITTETSGKHELLINAQNFEQQVVELELPASSSESDLKVTLSQFEMNNDNYQIMNIISNKLGLNYSDTIKIEKIIAIINPDNSYNDNNTVINDPINSSNKIITSYEEYFGYNIKEINTSNALFKKMINKAVEREKAGNKIYIHIKSSASKVPTKTFKSNINLATLRGEEAKEIILKTLIEKGANKNNIIVKPINSIISGPNYRRDYKNSNKYAKFQYVKINVM
jgi:hypothetical protein